MFIETNQDGYLFRCDRCGEQWEGSLEEYPRRWISYGVVMDEGGDLGGHVRIEVPGRAESLHPRIRRCLDFCSYACATEWFEATIRAAQRAGEA